MMGNSSTSKYTKQKEARSTRNKCGKQETMHQVFRLSKNRALRLLLLVAEFDDLFHEKALFINELFVLYDFKRHVSSLGAIVYLVLWWFSPLRSSWNFGRKAKSFSLFFNRISCTGFDFLGFATKT